MNKFLFKLLLTLLIATNIFSPSVRAEKDTSGNTKPKKPPSIFQSILRLFKSPESRFITRGEHVCLVSPGNLGDEIIWSDRPLFVWQGKILQSEINLFSPATNDDEGEDEELIWSETVSPDTQTIAYTGENLQPGFTYNWKLLSSGKTYSQTITVMESSARKAIATELAAIENELQTSGANTEEIAIAKADYFIQQKLGSDALQQLYSVENPSPNLTQQITDIEQYLCE